MPGELALGNGSMAASLSAAQPQTQRRRRRPIKTSEVREIARLYADRAITVAEIADRTKRPESTVLAVLRPLKIRRRVPQRAGTRPDLRRRNAKIIEGLLMGDTHDQVLRRWSIRFPALYRVLAEYRRMTGMPHGRWRELFLRYMIRFFLT